ncbi:MAG: branched-chain amino acid ABC transporter permease [Oceanospirillaceae bacterium]|uniref:branched-chain amino acid ABC transporter permease n=1 Tax=Marinobacterium litorale TaxID=404770 RepID=UPI00040B2EB5|nr:branched-chain amino acid ABC transporter permease [Marinobacterium litorale]MBT00400.1 branched-chain amino acid ABC transporter permease [Oceanospirillaceae bacterium]
MLGISIFNGLVYGSLLVICASGLAMIYGLRRVVNFAHGALYMLGAYIGYTLSIYLNFWFALVLAPLAMLVIGMLLDKAVFRPLQDRDPLSVLLVTFGLLLVFEDLVRAVWGRGNLSIDVPELLSSSVELFGNPTPLYRLAVIGLGVGSMVALWAWLRFSRTGLYVRAASTDPLTTAMMGVNTERVNALVVGIGTALAGLAGVAAGPMLSLAPSMGGDVLVDSFVVVVIGGLGSLGGALVSAILLGQVQSFGTIYLPSLSAVLPFLMMIAILIWRPSGLAGNRV